MPMRKAIRVRHELLEKVKKEVERTEYKSLSEFVSDAVRLRLQALAKERLQEYLQRDRESRASHLEERLFYTPRHIHAQMTPQGHVKVGMTDHFRDRLKQIVNIRTDDVGEEVCEDEPFGVVETWWFIYDLYSPLNGKIVSVNRDVIEDPFSLNVDSHQWILEVHPEGTEANSWMNGLLSLREYKELVARLEGGAH